MERNSPRETCDYIVTKKWNSVFYSTDVDVATTVCGESIHELCTSRAHKPKVCPNPKCKSPYWARPRQKGKKKGA